MFFFISQLEVSLSILIFKCQSRISKILKDLFFSNISFLKSQFIPIKSQIILENEYNCNDLKVYFENELKKNTEEVKKTHTFRIQTDSIHPAAIYIIKKNQGLIESYLGKNFLFEPPMYWRNFNIDKQYASYDIISNVWHQDSHDGNRMLKIFLLVNDIDEHDGPLIYLTRKDTIKNWPLLRERWSFEKGKGIKHFNCEEKLIGQKGNFLIVDTSRHMHRASIPNNWRDLYQVSLYPRWHKAKGRTVYSEE